MINTAIIGMGFIGNIHAEAHTKFKGVNLKAIVEKNEKIGHAEAEKYNVRYYCNTEEMLKNEDIDLVVISLPTYLHEKYVILSARYKKHILCEKPVTFSLESLTRMSAAAEAAGVKFMTGQCLRFWPEYQYIKKMYDSGKFGDVRAVYASRIAQHPDWTTWHTDPEKSGGCFFDLHIHDIDYLRFIFGKIESVYAIGFKSENGCYDHVFTSIVFKNNIKAVAEASYEVQSHYPFTSGIRIHGEKATLEHIFKTGFNIENMGDSFRSTTIFLKDNIPQVLEFEQSDAFIAELAYFVDCIEYNKPLGCASASDVGEVLKVMLAAKKSLETGQIIKLCSTS